MIWLAVGEVRVHSGPPRGGSGGTRTPGPMDFRRPMGLKGPRRGPNGLYRAHRRPFLRFKFGEDLFFFGDHLKIWKKECHFPCSFWTAQNQTRAKFELFPGPPSAISAPGCTASCKIFGCNGCK